MISNLCNDIIVCILLSIISVTLLCIRIRLCANYVYHFSTIDTHSQLDEDFLLQYQLNYGSHAPILTPNPIPLRNKKENSSRGATTTQAEDDDDESPLGKRQKPSSSQPQAPEWFQVDDVQNTKVYVSNLPTDISMEEYLEVMQKCGLIMKDVNTNEYKVKLYEDQEGNKKGDGLCTYIKVSL